MRGNKKIRKSTFYLSTHNKKKYFRFIIKELKKNSTFAILKNN